MVEGVGARESGWSPFRSWRQGEPMCRATDGLWDMRWGGDVKPAPRTALGNEQGDSGSTRGRAGGAWGLRRWEGGIWGPGAGQAAW